MRQYVAVVRGQRSGRGYLGGLSLLAVAPMGVSCGSGRPSADSTVSSTSVSPSSGCWPSGTAADGTAQATTVTVAHVELRSASKDPPPKVTWSAAKTTMSKYEPGATAVRAFLATVSSPYQHAPKRVCAVIECNVPYTSKGGGGSGVAIVVGAVDPGSGALLFSGLAGTWTRPIAPPRAAGRRWRGATGPSKVGDRSAGGLADVAPSRCTSYVGGPSGSSSP
ncbi:MAG: hypothetical protein ACP5P1_06715 [Acidimicrobiales bacterium]